MKFLRVQSLLLTLLLLPSTGTSGEKLLNPATKVEIKDLGYALPQPIVNRLKLEQLESAESKTPEAPGLSKQENAEAFPWDIEVYKTADGLIYCADSISMSFWIRRDDAWICLLSNLRVRKTFGGEPAFLLVRYLGKGFFAFSSTVPGEIKENSADGFPRALGITFLLDSTKGEIVERSDSFPYQENPPVKPSKDWFAKYSLPAPASDDK